MWRESWRADPIGRAIADRHYNRQSVGAAQFVPPGRCIVLLADDERSLWVTSWPDPKYVQHDWPGAWMNTMFRREGGAHLASDMIRAAVAATRAVGKGLDNWPGVPELGMVTFVDADKVRAKRDPGYCYRKAGFRHVGFTKGGLLAYQLLPADMPEPVAPMNRRGALDLAGAA